MRIVVEAHYKARFLVLVVFKIRSNHFCWFCNPKFKLPLKDNSMKSAWYYNMDHPFFFFPIILMLQGTS